MIDAETIKIAERRSPTRRDEFARRLRAGSETGAPREFSDRSLPPISRSLLRLFSWYSRRYVRRHFHSLRVSRATQFPSQVDMPLVIFSNHASWWDPLAGLLIARKSFPERKLYVPMDAQALERYAFFKRLGVFGVEQNTPRGAAKFLRVARDILNRSESVLWLTPHARFADVREQPGRFKPGIGHLPRLGPQICFLSVAIEYTFWEERLPEILIRFGAPRITRGDGPGDTMRWTDRFSGDLSETQSALAAEVVRRNPGDFENLLSGRSGVGGIYDCWRAFKARVAGQEFHSEHGKL